MGEAGGRVARLDPVASTSLELGYPHPLDRWAVAATGPGLLLNYCNDGIILVSQLAKNRMENIERRC